MSDLKLKLHELCIAYVQERIDSVGIAIKATQQAANEETKSSAGDKYETGRAMMQQDSDRNMAQLNEANKLMAALKRISTLGTSATAEAGSIVVTNQAKFYLSISAGILSLNGESYFAISPASPIGMLLKGKGAGDRVGMNGKTYQIEKVI